MACTWAHCCSEAELLSFWEDKYGRSYGVSNSTAEGLRAPKTLIDTYGASEAFDASTNPTREAALEQVHRLYRGATKTREAKPMPVVKLFFNMSFRLSFSESAKQGCTECLAHRLVALGKMSLPDGNECVVELSKKLPGDLLRNQQLLYRDQVCNVKIIMNSCVDGFF